MRSSGCAPSLYQHVPELPRHTRKRLLIGQLEGQPDELPWQQENRHLGQRVAYSEGGHLRPDAAVIEDFISRRRQPPVWRQRRRGLSELVAEPGVEAHRYDGRRWVKVHQHEMNPFLKKSEALSGIAREPQP